MTLRMPKAGNNILLIILKKTELKFSTMMLTIVMNRTEHLVLFNFLLSALRIGRGFYSLKQVPFEKIMNKKY